MTEYRKAGIDDADELVRMRIEFLNDLQKPGTYPYDGVLEANLREYFMRNLSSGSFISYVAVDNGAIVGTSGIYFYNMPPSYKNKEGKVAYIMNMYTRPAYRGNGIASSLFEKIVAEAKERGCHKISLHATDMGKPVYMKFGFKETDNELSLTLP